LTVGIAVSLVCLYFATRGTDWARVADVLASARLGWVAALMIASLAAVYIRAERWRVLLRPLGRVPLYPALSATAIGFGATAVLPLRIGEVLRPALLGRRAGVGISAAFGSVVLERLFDVLFVIGCFLGVSLSSPLPAAVRRSAWVLSGLATVALITLIVMQRRRGSSERLFDRLLGLLPPRIASGLRPVARSFVAGLGGLSDGATMALVVVYSLALWGVIALTFVFGFLALDTPVPLVRASVTTAVIVAGFVLLPQAPGFVGTWQAGCVLALGLFGVPKDAAVGYSLLTWIVAMGTYVGAAGFFLAREDLSVGQLLRVAERDAATPGGGR
jgi:hypothetical protein